MRDATIAIAILAGLILLVAVCTLVYLKAKAKWFGRNGLIKKKLLTANELDFYQKLLLAVSPRWTVLAQVSMGALLDTALKPAHPRYWEVRNTFAQKICDFVLCDPRTLEPVLIVIRKYTTAAVDKMVTLITMSVMKTQDNNMTIAKIAVA